MSQPLWSSFTLWILNKNKTLSNDSYSQQLHPYCTFSTIAQFYSVYTYIARPSTVYTRHAHNDDTVVFHVFRTGVSPLWEDQANTAGGRLCIRIKRNPAHTNTDSNSNNGSDTSTYIDRIWEDVLLMLIGDPYNCGHDLNGVVLTHKNNEYFINVWNTSAHDSDGINRLKAALKATLNIPQHMMASVVDYKPHDNALKHIAK